MLKVFLKRLPLLSLFVFVFSYSQNIADHAFGIRIGESQGFGTELSYQKGLRNDKRIEVDLGFRRRIVQKTVSYRATILYHWVYDISPEFIWFIGFGGGAGSWMLETTSAQNNPFGFLVGNIGIESDFDLPLQVALDLRPQLGLLNYGNESIYDIAVSVRYRF